jgi:hypothetical protein
MAPLRHQIAHAAKAAWTMSLNNDLRIPSINRRRTPAVRASNTYALMVFRAAQHDPIVASTFMRVANLVRPPAILARPDVALRVLVASARRATGPATNSTLPSSSARASLPGTNRHDETHHQSTSTLISGQPQERGSG